MTRPYGQRVDCPHCGGSHTEETSFNRWFRSHPKLESGDGIVRFDNDMIVHNYKPGLKDGFGTRDIQCLMFVEVKTRGAGLRQDQQDTLSLVSQIFRNRRDNMHRKKRGRQARKKCDQCGAIESFTITEAYSRMMAKWIDVRLYGFHLLEFENTDPTDGWILWDGQHFLTPDELIGVIRFDLDPDTIQPTDFRRRSKGRTAIHPRLFND